MYAFILALICKLEFKQSCNSAVGHDNVKCTALKVFIWDVYPVVKLVQIWVVGVSSSSRGSGYVRMSLFLSLAFHSTCLSVGNKN